MALLTSRSTLRKGQSWNHLRPGTWTTCRRGLPSLRDARRARAGYWQLDQETERLVQLGFVPGVGLDPEVGRQFAAATATVPLSQTSLGIVAAALTGQPAVSRVAELPADSGSGRWLVRFGASRSVAVPIRGEGGMIQGVFSVALTADSTLGDRLVAERIRVLGQLLVPPGHVLRDWTPP